jgi:hypothetical protein
MKVYVQALVVGVGIGIGFSVANNALILLLTLFL